MDLIKPLVLKSKQVKSFKTAQSLGGGSLRVTTVAQAVDEQSKQTGSEWGVRDESSVRGPAVPLCALCVPQSAEHPLP